MRRPVRIVLAAFLTIAWASFQILAIIVENVYFQVTVALLILPLVDVLQAVVRGEETNLEKAWRAIMRREAHLQNLYAKVRNSWIDGFLLPTTDASPLYVSFTYVPVSELAQTTAAAICSTPVDLSLSPEQEKKQLQEDITKSHSQLLILGLEGAGKSIAMLKLLRAALDQDKINPNTNFVPVVLNLSTWNLRGAREKQSFAEWVTYQLRIKYQIPKTEAMRLLNNNQLYFLLDGLDEVRIPEDESSSRAHKPAQDDAWYRERQLVYIAQVVREFNAFVRPLLSTTVARKQIRFVLCCRAETYDTLPEKPLASGALMMHTLTEEQALRHVEQAGNNKLLLQTLREHDRMRAEALKPYTLNVMLKTFKDDLRFTWSKDQIIKVFESEQLLETYVYTRLGNPEKERLYDNDDIYRWLGQVASFTEHNGGAEFLIEELQPSLLENQRTRRQYQALYLSLVALFTMFVIAVPQALAIAVEWAYLADLAKGIEIGLTMFVALMIAIMVCMPLALVLSNMTYINEQGVSGSRAWWYLLAPFWRSFKNGGWKLALVLGLFAAIVRGLLRWLSFDATPTSVITNFVATFVALTFALSWLTGEGMFFENINQIRLADAREWNPRRAMNGFFAGLSIGVILFIITLVQLALNTVSENINLIVARAGSGGLVLTICFTILFGFTGSRAKLSTTTRANQGIWQLSIDSLRSYALLAFVGVIALGIGYGALLEPPAGIVNGILGLAFGMCSIAFGVLSVFKHIALRYVLTRQTLIPLNLAKFLDYTTELTLTRKVGGRYLFEHRTLREYFRDTHGGRQMLAVPEVSKAE